jgi:hypothetical protein
MLIAHTEERTHKKKRLSKHKACINAFQIWFDPWYNYKFKVSVYKVIIMNVSQVYKDKGNPVLRYNLT